MKLPHFLAHSWVTVRDTGDELPGVVRELFPHAVRTLYQRCEVCGHRRAIQRGVGHQPVDGDWIITGVFRGR